MDDVDAIPYLYCVQCSHDLNHPLYLVQSHPVIPSLLLCILCYEVVNNRLQQVIPSKSRCTDDHNSSNNGEVISILDARSEICNICFDGGDLYLCGDEQSCNRAYCRDCIVSLFGSNELQRIDQLPYWKCYCCDSDQGVVNFFKDASVYAEKQSMYNQKVVTCGSARAEGEGGDMRRAETLVGFLSGQIMINNNNNNEEEEEKEDEMEAMRELSILKAIVESCDEALVSIERDAIQEKEREVREELFQRQLIMDPTSRYNNNYYIISNS